MEKRIKDFEEYAITDEGQVISYKYKAPRVLKTWYQKTGYENIKLSKNGETYHFLIHRLVAMAFLPNPQNLNHVDHIDNNRQNNKLENLRWISAKDNVNKSYIASGVNAVRNFIPCLLIEESGDNIIGEFNSKTDACNYAYEHFGCSKSSLMKYGRTNGYKIVKCRD